MNRGAFITKSLRRRLLYCVILTALLAAGTAACAALRKVPVTERSAFALNTFVTVSVYGKADPKVAEEAVSLCGKYEKVFSATDEESELWQVNHRAPGTRSMELSEALAETVATGLEYARISDGAFDITILPVKQLWDFTAEQPELPDPEALEEAVRKVGWERLGLEGRTLRFADDEVQIDLGAVAKGYIADRIAEYLRGEGVTSAVINLGGNVLCVGHRPDGSDFRIGLQKPYADHNETVAALRVSGLSVVTSGVYERHFVINDVNYHHILDPRTGRPYENGLTGVSVVCASSEEADALSTTVLCLGPERGMELIDSRPDAWAFLVTEDGEILYSEGAKELLAE